MRTSEKEVFEECREKYAVIQINVVSSETRNLKHATFNVKTLCYQLIKQSRQLCINNLIIAYHAERDLLERQKRKCEMHDKHVK